MRSMASNGEACKVARRFVDGFGFGRRSMNSRTSGVIIALSSAVAGSLAPSAVGAYLAETYVIASGLGAIVVLNTIIALLHIYDRDDGVAVRAAGEKTVPKKPARPVQPAAEKVERPAAVANLRRVKAPPLAGQAESPSVANTA